MFVVRKTIGITKDSRNEFIERFNHDSPLFKAAGFIKREVLLNDSLADRDIIVIHLYWQDKTDYIAWQRSPVHMELHKAKAKLGKPANILSKEKEMFTLIHEHSAV